METTNTIDSIINQIRAGEKGRNNAVLALYNDAKLRSMVYKFVLKNGGDQADAKSVFNYSLAKFVKAVIQNKDFYIQQELIAYIYGIARYTWYDEIAQKQKTVEMESERIPDFTDNVSSHDRMVLAERKVILHDLLTTMHRNCKEVLLHWAGGYTMEEIAKIVHYKSFHMAKKKKYECMKQLLKYIEDNPEIQEKLTL